MSEQEKKDKKFGMIVSGIIHASLILIFFVLVAWREPDPPIPVYGIELNLGFQEEGGGDTEREVETQVEDTAEEELPDAAEETEEIVEPEEQVEEVIEETPPPPVEEVVEEVIEDPITAENSEVAVEEKQEETVEEVVETETEEEKKEEEQPPVEKPKPKPDPRAQFPGKKTESESTEETSNNQGDDRARMGNQGRRDGDVNDGTDVSAGDGLSYSLAGWDLVKRKVERDESQVEGIIVFDIQVDDRGVVQTATMKPGKDGTTITDMSIVRYYEKQIRAFIFKPKDQDKVYNGLSKGTVTLVIETN